MATKKHGAGNSPSLDPLFVQDIDFETALKDFFEGGCTAEQKKKCTASSGEFLDAVCNACKWKDWEPNRYVAQLWKIHLLQLAGMVFDCDLFEIGFWLDLGMLKQEIENRRIRL